MSDLDTFKSRAYTAAGAGGTVLAVNELEKASHHHLPEDERTAHLVKAVTGAAVAIGAYELLKRGERLPTEHFHDQSTSKIMKHDNDTVVVSHRQRERGDRRHRHRSRSHSGSDSRSPSPDYHEPGHKRRVFEEIIGAYSLGRELLGDHEHHVTHLVAEALGMTALVKEAARHT